MASMLGITGPGRVTIPGPGGPLVPGSGGRSHVAGPGGNLIYGSGGPYTPWNPPKKLKQTEFDDTEQNS